MPDKPKQRLSAVEVLGLATYVGSFFILLSTTTLAGWRFWTYGLQDVPAIVIAAVLLVLTIIPLQWTDTPTFRRYIRWTCRSAGLYFPVHMIVEGACAVYRTQGPQYPNAHACCTHSWVLCTSLPVLQTLLRFKRGSRTCSVSAGATHAVYF